MVYTVFILSLIAGLIFFVLVILVYSVLVYRKQGLIRRMERQLIASKEKKFSILGMLGAEDFLTNMQKKLKRAGFSFDAEETILILSIFAFILFVICVISGFGLMSFLVPPAVFYLFSALLDKLGSAKYEKINIQFADAVQDMADYLKVSGNFINAVQRVAFEADEPLKSELQKIVSKVNAGISVLTALKDFADDVQSPLVESWADAVVFSFRMKANTADVCESAAKKVRMRLRQNQKINAMLKGTKSTIYMIVAVMALMLVMTYASSPMYLAVFKTLMGKIALLYTIVSYAGTTIFMLKKMNKEVKSV